MSSSSLVRCDPSMPHDLLQIYPCDAPRFLFHYKRMRLVPQMAVSASFFTSQTYVPYLFRLALSALDFCGREARDIIGEAAQTGVVSHHHTTRGTHQLLLMPQVASLT